MALRWDQSGLVGHTPSGQAREGLPEAPRRAAFPARYYAVAASLVAVIAIGAMLLLSPMRDGGAPVPGAAVVATELASPVGTIRRVTLDDGSVVTLDTGTRLEVAFTQGERRLRLLAGRARFEVAHDAGRPFIVAAGDGEVVATGTIFDVSLVGARPRVRLIQGSVEVRSRSAVLARRARSLRS
ncbi:MAG: FecR domain-containing protein [Sphingomonas sp.]